MLGKSVGVKETILTFKIFITLYLYNNITVLLNIFILIKFTLQSQLESKNLLKDIKQVGFSTFYTLN